ncbi:MAG: hypothetical protein RL335_499 [Bacteroidota bacterium]
MSYKIYSGNDLFEMEDADFSAFRTSYTIIQAAGGIVKDEMHRILFIFRRGVWDLPKGKLDEGETYIECAKREVEEECGIIVEAIDDLVYTTYHTYEEKGKKILKETFWFEMWASNQQKLTPQTEEQISAIEWADNFRQQELLKNTYPMIRDMIIAMNQKPL